MITYLIPIHKSIRGFLITYLRPINRSIHGFLPDPFIDDEHPNKQLLKFSAKFNTEAIEQAY